jgi:hypothetical protein
MRGPRRRASSPLSRPKRISRTWVAGAGRRGADAPHATWWQKGRGRRGPEEWDRPRNSPSRRPPGREHVARIGGPPMRITSNTGRTSKRRASFCDTPPERARRGAALVYMRNLTPTSRRPRRRSSREIACRLFGFDRGVFKEKLTYGNITRLQQHEDLVRDGGFWFVPPRWEGGASLHDNRAVVRKICRVVGCVIF